MTDDREALLAEVGKLTRRQATEDPAAAYALIQRMYAALSAPATQAPAAHAEPPCTRNGGHELPDPGCMHCGWSPYDDAYYRGVNAGLDAAETLAAPLEAAQPDARDAARLDQMRCERDRNRAGLDHAIEHLTRIHSLLYPTDVQAHGMTYRFNFPHSLSAADVLRRLTEEIRAIPAVIDAALAAQEAPPNER